MGQFLPVMTEKILDLYATASDLNLDLPTQELLIKAVIRQVNLLIELQQGHGEMSQAVLDSLVEGKRIKSEGTDATILIASRIRKTDLAQLLIDAQQRSWSSSFIDKYLNVLAAVITSLSRLGLKRRHVFYVKDLLQRLVPTLIEARKIGASEMGVHPATGIPQPHDRSRDSTLDLTQGTRALFSLVTQTAGVSATVPDEDNSIDGIRQRLQRWCKDSASGDQSIRVEMLKLCVSVCDALPDIPASLHFTSQLLRNARRAVTNHSNATSREAYHVY